MLLLYILIAFCVVYTLFKLKGENTYTLHKRVIDKETCNKIIEISNKYKVDDADDSVDDLPTFQITVYNSFDEDNPVGNKELLDTIKPIYNKYIEPLFKKPPDHIFLRRYKVDERTELPIHLDQSNFTVSFILSDKNEYEGGELFIFSKEETKKYDHLTLTSTPRYIRDEFVRNHKKLPVVNYEQGDMISYNGKDYLHGVLPITKGVRYTLIFFFEKPLMN